MKWFDKAVTTIGAFNSAQKETDGKISNSSVIGVGGTQIYGGYINTPEKDPNLRGQKKYITYGEMLANTSIVGAGTRFFLNLVAKAEWKFEFEKADAEIEDALYKIQEETLTPWYRVVRRTAMYRFHGFGIQEWTAKKLDDGTIGYLDVQARPQFTVEQWDTDLATGFVNGVVQRSPQDGRSIYLPRQKLIYAVDDAISDSPEGLGLFRHLADPVKRLRDLERLEGIGFEADLRGVPVMRMPLTLLKAAVANGTLKKEDLAAAVAGVETFLNNHVKGTNQGVMLDSAVYTSSDDAETPSGEKLYDMSLLQGTSTAQQEVRAAIGAINYEIARVLGVEGLLVGGTSNGSHALSKDKSSNLYMLVDSTLKELGEIYEKDYLDPLFMMNGWDKKRKPVMKTESIQFTDIEQITSALRDMAQAGAVLAPNDPAIDDIRDLLGLSQQPNPVTSNSITIDDLLQSGQGDKALQMLTTMVNPTTLPASKTPQSKKPTNEQPPAKNRKTQ